MKFEFPFSFQLKRFCAMICAVVLCLSMTACGGSEQPSNDESNPTDAAVADTQATGEETEPATEPYSSKLLSCTYKVPMEEIYIDVPEFQEMMSGYTELFMELDSRFVSFTSDRRATAENAKEAHEINLAYFIPNLEYVAHGANYLTIVKEEMIEVNGMEVYAFEGTINYGQDNPKDYYAKGYAFVFNGVPCESVGSVIDDAQPEEMITEISIILDEMIKTVRDKE